MWKAVKASTKHCVQDPPRSYYAIFEGAAEALPGRRQQDKSGIQTSVALNSCESIFIIRRALEGGCMIVYMYVHIY